MTSEAVLVAAIVDALNAQPDIIAFRNNTGVARVHGSHVRYGLGNGSPDIVAVLAPWGHFVALEVKLPGEGAEPDQIHWAARLDEYGGSYWLVRSLPESFAAVDAARGLMASPRDTGNALPASHMTSVRDSATATCTKHPTPCVRCQRFLATCAARLGVKPHTTNENASARILARAISKKGRHHGN